MDQKSGRWFLKDKFKEGSFATKQEAHQTLIKKIRHSCLKTIVAFLNADGGRLVIGVYENKELQINEVIGIEEDAKDQTKEKKEFYSRDDYLHLITSNIENKIIDGKKLLGDLIHIYFEKKSNGKTVCIIKVDPFYPREGQALACLKPEQGNKVRPEDRKEDEVYERRINKSEKLSNIEAMELLWSRKPKN